MAFVALGGLLAIKGLLEVVRGLLEKLIRLGSAGPRALEFTKRLALESEVTELLDMRLCRQRLDGLVLLTERLDPHVVALRIFHPVGGEEIAEARPDILAVNISITTAVIAPRRLSGVCSGKGIDVLVGIQVWEHGARFAGLDVEGQLLEHLIVIHLLEDFIELVSIDVRAAAVRDAEKACTSVVSEVHEHLRGRIGLESGAIAVIA